MKLIIYFSRATRPMEQEDLRDLLATARRNNKGKGITGLLLYSDGFFLQGIEGETAPVIEMFDKILKDPRHDQVTELYNQTTTERCFPEWGMGFHQVEGHELAGQPGYVPLLKDNFCSEDVDMDDEMTFHLLCLFRQFVNDEHAK